MEKETNVERFYAWMHKIKSIHLANTLRMEKAFEIIEQN